MKLVQSPLLLILLFILAPLCRAQVDSVAVIDTDAFSQNERGIVQLVRATKDIEIEFSHCGRSGTLSKSECQSALQQRIKERINPVMGKIAKQLAEFTRRKGIGLLLDKSNTSCALPCRWEVLADRDVTDEFISEYNRLNP